MKFHKFKNNALPQLKFLECIPSNRGTLSSLPLDVEYLEIMSDVKS
jgi:hypothetical protein